MFSSLSILTVADDGSKQRYINNENRSVRKGEFRGKFCFPNVKKLNTRSHAKYLAAILKNPYYTPCNIGHILTSPPPPPPLCNTDKVITHSWRYDLLHFEFMTYAKISIS